MAKAGKGHLEYGCSSPATTCMWLKLARDTMLWVVASQGYQEYRVSWPGTCVFVVAVSQEHIVCCYSWLGVPNLLF